jgi:glutaredoxin-related protein
MKKYYALTAVIVLGLFFLIYLKNAQTADITGNEKIILFYGKECPHCQIVEDYIKKNNITGKVEFIQAEIFHNSNNQKIFVEKNKTCGITDEKEMGVPLLWADGKCMIGQDKVIEFFASNAK